MEPLSIAASTVNFLSVYRLLENGFRYLKQVKGAPNEIQALIEELNRFQAILKALDLVTQQRRDDSFGPLLSSCSEEADRIINDLCNVSGISSHKLKESGDDEDKTAHVNVQLLDRFKWTRAKGHVEKLCERLKVLRLDYANLLAGSIMCVNSRLLRPLS